jgi:hypothetical protein
MYCLPCSARKLVSWAPACSLCIYHGTATSPRPSEPIVRRVHSSIEVGAALRQTLSPRRGATASRCSSYPAELHSISIYHRHVPAKIAHNRAGSRVADPSFDLCRTCEFGLLKRSRLGWTEPPRPWPPVSYFFRRNGFCLEPRETSRLSPGFNPHRLSQLRNLYLGAELHLRPLWQHHQGGQQRGHELLGRVQQRHQPGE